MALSEWLGQTPGAFDLLKMDCEGSEWEIVRQTRPSDLARFRAVVAEVHEDPEGQQPVEAVRNACSSLPASGPFDGTGRHSVCTWVSVIRKRRVYEPATCPGQHPRAGL